MVKVAYHRGLRVSELMCYTDNKDIFCILSNKERKQKHIYIYIVSRSVRIETFCLSRLYSLSAGFFVTFTQNKVSVYLTPVQNESPWPKCEWKIPILAVVGLLLMKISKHLSMDFYIITYN